MKGYKYALHINVLTDDGGFVSPVLVVLDIPDDALKSTPKMRYNDFLSANGLEYADYYRYVNTDRLSLLTKYISLVEKMDYYASFYNSRQIELISSKQNLADIDNFVHSSKCRCSEAKVVDIIGMFDGVHYNNAISDFKHDFEYVVGSTVKPDEWDHDWLKICGRGIHFFKHPILALLYKLPADFKAAKNFMGRLDDDFKNTYMTEELNKLE